MRHQSGIILLVEDDADTADAVSLMLACEGWGVAVATNGARAMEWLGGASGVVPAAIIADRRMPRLSGPELFRALRASVELRAVPFIEITADRGVPPEPGLAASLYKPFSGDELLDTINRVLERVREHAMAPARAAAIR